MPTKIRTPIGDFGTIKAAAEALGVGRDTVVKRLITDITNYQRVEYTPIKTTLPPWQQYRMWEFERKDQVWLAWCKDKGLDPELESTAEAFFDEMDQVILSEGSEDPEEDTE
jgi:hypothetical protein